RLSTPDGTVIGRDSYSQSGRRVNFGGDLVAREGESPLREIRSQDDVGRAGRRYGQSVNRSRIALRLRSIQGGVDWAVAVVLAGAGLADAIKTHFAQPVWAGALVTLFVFLPLGLRRRFPLPGLGTVAAASLVLELA